MPAAPLPGIMSASPSDSGKREQAVHRLFARVADQRSGMDCGGAAEPRPGGDRLQQQRSSLSRLLSHVEAAPPQQQQRGGSITLVFPAARRLNSGSRDGITLQHTASYYRLDYSLLHCGCLCLYALPCRDTADCIRAAAGRR